MLKVNKDDLVVGKWYLIEEDYTDEVGDDDLEGIFISFGKFVGSKTVDEDWMHPDMRVSNKFIGVFHESRPVEVRVGDEGYLNFDEGLDVFEDEYVLVPQGEGDLMTMAGAGDGAQRITYYKVTKREVPPILLEMAERYEIEVKMGGLRELTL